MKKTYNKDLYFIGDLHLNHKNILKYDNRPFEDVTEMNEQLIKNIHDTVPKKCILVLVGDVTMFYKSKKGVEIFKQILKDIDRPIIHVRGNHDDYDITGFDNVLFTCDTLNLSVVDDRHPHSKQKIFISHYPVKIWESKHNGSFHIHAHCHGNEMINDPNWYEENYVIDVGANCINYKPISYEELYQIMINKNIILSL